ncbi:sensor histidine kinase [Marinobacterium nitratireducens]|uniref:histidine kinase n=1 Tax=Marinobacterium nitratireducens TaxID=518897 RepID=A0A917Z9B7_9GAMM|nr:ATP-binding protein [Marinobacterium nitratireducens]GGO78748.1 sensor histidine kinase [Marinobacterium nitratireducens]
MFGNRQQLLQLTYIRTFALFGLSLLLLYAVYGLRTQIDNWLASATLLAMALVNVVTYKRLGSRLPVTNPELFGQLTADAVLYGALFYQTGGATNPFIFMLLIPLIIAATTLPWRYTWLTAALVVAIYGSLLLHHMPLWNLADIHQHQLPKLFNLHITGMWLSFLLTVMMIGWFVARMHESLMQQQQRLERARQKRIEDQQLLALANSAAGTAHELGTPLGTMRVLLREMEIEHRNDSELLEDIHLLQQQVAVCSDRLQSLARSVQDEPLQAPLRPFVEILDEVIDQWLLMRPEVSFSRHQPSGDSPWLRCQTTLIQALLNLFNNAADACPDNIDIRLEWDARDCWLRIRDRGPGLPLERSEELGKPFVTTKGRGLGIGLFLTTSTLASLDGEVRLYNDPEGGTLTEVRLPRATANDDRQPRAQP